MYSTATTLSNAARVESNAASLALVKEGLAVP